MTIILRYIILREPQSLGLDKNDCCGQCHDNEANMVGMNSDVKTKILAINPSAFFTVCGYHNWNLLLGDATKSSRTAISFFDLIQRIYTLFFFRSSKRWVILNQKLEITLRPLSET
jgi:hypothetical protein